VARAVRETSHAYKFHHSKNSPTSNISNYKKNPPNLKIKTPINPISNKPKNPNQRPPLQINWLIFLDPLLPTNLTNFITPIYTTQTHTNPNHMYLEPNTLKERLQSKFTSNIQESELTLIIEAVRPQPAPS
jgi:hypothetical protein